MAIKPITLEWMMTVIKLILAALVTSGSNPAITTENITGAAASPFGYCIYAVDLEEIGDVLEAQAEIYSLQYEERVGSVCLWGDIWEIVE